MNMDVFGVIIPPVLNRWVLLLSTLQEGIIRSGLFILVAFPVSLLPIPSSFYRLPCEQYGSAKILRATSLEHTATLRVLV